jgi:hypothetical protein
MPPYRLSYKHPFAEPLCGSSTCASARLISLRFSRRWATWLERNNRPIEHFGIEVGDGGGIIIKAQFEGDDLAELFRRQFRGDYGD